MTRFVRTVPAAVVAALVLTLPMSGLAAASAVESPPVDTGVPVEPIVDPSPPDETPPPDDGELTPPIEPPPSTSPSPSPTPSPTPSPSPDPDDGDGGDDGNGDGGSNGPIVRTGLDRDCIDFDTQEAAQVALDATDGDPERLDGNNNGIACEANQGEFTADTAPDGVRKGSQISVIPVGGVDTGGAA
jgi:Excalibur calcium-binding domain